MRTLKDVSEIIEILRQNESPENKAGMARYGINTENAFGVTVNFLRNLAHDIGTDHVLAQQLWNTGFHEARILASVVDEPSLVTRLQMEQWVAEINSWDLCDQVIGNLFFKTQWAWEKALEWANKDEEFVRRAGFVLMARLAVKDKKAANERFEQFFPLIIKYSCDNRNYVRKSVNWALRQIGKRNLELNKEAIKIAEELIHEKDKTTKWIGLDALRELTSASVKKRFFPA